MASERRGSSRRARWPINKRKSRLRRPVAVRALPGGSPLLMGPGRLRHRLSFDSCGRGDPRRTALGHGGRLLKRGIGLISQWGGWTFSPVQPWQGAFCLIQHSQAFEAFPAEVLREQAFHSTFDDQLLHSDLVPFCKGQVQINLLVDEALRYGSLRRWTNGTQRGNQGHRPEVLSLKRVL